MLSVDLTLKSFELALNSLLLIFHLDESLIRVCVALQELLVFLKCVILGLSLSMNFLQVVTGLLLP